MRTWSDRLIELSREYLNYDDTHVKSIKGQFGILNIDYENNIYTIKLKSENQSIMFYSVDEIIDSGWVVD